MSRFRLSNQAKADVHAIWDYIGITNGNPTAAQDQVESLYEKFKLLATQPMMGQLREDLRCGLRAFVAGSYVILYFPMPDGIEVAGVVHGAQDVESMFHRGRSVRIGFTAWPAENSGSWWASA